MSKKTKGTKYKSEEDVYEDLLRLIPIWKNKFYANSSNAGSWSVTGGHTLAGENKEEAIIRKIKKEV